jgi:hypothetical protein
LSAVLSSLRAFIAAVIRPRTPLAKAIMLVMVVKLAGIIAIRAVVLADSAAPLVDATTMARMIGPSAPAR